jgi:hypothetical protein
MFGCGVRTIRPHGDPEKGRASYRQEEHKMAKFALYAELKAKAGKKQRYRRF